MDAGELALMKDNNGFGNMSFMWIFALLLLFGGGGFGFNRNPGPAPNVATQEYVQQAINNQGINQQLNQIALSSANNNYETARLIQTQTAEMQAQNNTNLINAIQGFNQVNLNTQNQTNVLSQQIQQLGAHLDECCCAIKTQMLQQQLDDANRRNTEKDAQISNLMQSQYILGQMGRFVAWAGSGSQAVTAGT